MMSNSVKNLARINRHRVTAVVYMTSRHRGDSLVVGMAFLRVVVIGGSDFTDHEGWYETPQNTSNVGAALVGKYCEIVLGGQAAAVRYYGAPTFQWNRGPDDGPELRCVMAYHHVTTARRAFEERLRLLDIGEAQVENVLSPIAVRVDDHRQGWCDCAGWDAANDRIVFGNGVEYVLDAVAIYHEYAHAVIDRLTEERFPCGYDHSGQGPAASATSVCEAFADYFACSMKNHPKVLEGSEGERDLSVRVRLERDTVQDVYEQSTALSSGLWELRGRFGAKVIDELVLRCLLELRSLNRDLDDCDLESAALTMIDVDRRWYSSQHIAEIAEVYRERNII